MCLQMQRVYMGVGGNMSVIEIPAGPSAGRQNFVAPPTGLYTEPGPDDTAFSQHDFSPNRPPNVLKLTPTPEQVFFTQ